MRDDILIVGAVILMVICVAVATWGHTHDALERQCLLHGKVELNGTLFECRKVQE